MKALSGIVPLAMSFAALAMVLIRLAVYGVAPEADGGTPAHIFQLLMVAQVPIVWFFVVTWLPRAPWRTLQVLAAQFSAALLAMVAVVLLT